MTSGTGWSGRAGRSRRAPPAPGAVPARGRNRSTRRIQRPAPPSPVRAPPLRRTDRPPPPLRDDRRAAVVAAPSPLRLGPRRNVKSKKRIASQETKRKRKRKIIYRQERGSRRNQISLQFRSPLWSLQETKKPNSQHTEISRKKRRHQEKEERA
jgi:hypothetical protein